MWQLADRVVKTVSDVTVGTAIVLVHVALARRAHAPTKPLVYASTRDGARTWRTSISP